MVPLQIYTYSVANLQFANFLWTQTLHEVQTEMKPIGVSKVIMKLKPLKGSNDQVVK